MICAWAAYQWVRMSANRSETTFLIRGGYGSVNRMRDNSDAEKGHVLIVLHWLNTHTHTHNNNNNNNNNNCHVVMFSLHNYVIFQVLEHKPFVLCALSMQFQSTAFPVVLHCSHWHSILLVLSSMSSLTEAAEHEMPLHPYVLFEKALILCLYNSLDIANHTRGI